MKKSGIIFFTALALLNGVEIDAGDSFRAVIGWGGNAAGEATGVPNWPDFKNHEKNKKTSPLAAGAVSFSERLLQNVTMVTAGGGFSLAINHDKTVSGWGDNYLGILLGEPTAGYRLTNGLVKLSGKVLSNIKSITAGYSYCLAIRDNGTVVQWGKADRVMYPAGLSNVVGVAASMDAALALRQNGTVIGWGEAPTVPHNLTNIVAIDLPKSEMLNGYACPWGLALRKDGVAIAWTHGSEYPDGKTIVKNAVAIAAGEYGLALLRDGTVAEWHGNFSGNSDPVQLVNINGQTLTDVVAISACGAIYMALKKDSTVVVWGQAVTQPPNGLTNVVAIAAGYSHCLAITTNPAVAEKFRQKQIIERPR